MKSLKIKSAWSDLHASSPYVAVHCLLSCTTCGCRRAGCSTGRHHSGHNYRSYTALHRVSPKQEVRNVQPP